MLLAVRVSVTVSSPAKIEWKRPSGASCTGPAGPAVSLNAAFILLHTIVKLRCKSRGKADAPLESVTVPCISTPASVCTLLSDTAR